GQKDGLSQAFSHSINVARNRLIDKHLATKSNIVEVLSGRFDDLDHSFVSQDLKTRSGSIGDQERANA
ncbi:MAG: hypothetical protein ACLPXB_09800, partial [Thiobacillaceae bacterium]